MKLSGFPQNNDLWQRGISPDGAGETNMQVGSGEQIYAEGSTCLVRALDFGLR